MKINKALFATSKEFSVFWNLNSKIYRTKLNIEPVCLLYGKKSDTDMTEDYGQVVEMPTLPGFPLLIQITWSKFFWPMQEPDTTWLIGDIDLMPLQRAWFTSNLESIAPDNYVHLDANGITQLSGSGYAWVGPQAGKAPAVLQHETNMPGHYHVAKGHTFTALRTGPTTFEEELRHICNGRYGNTRGFRESDPIDQANLWCAEEARSTELVRHAIQRHAIEFTGFSLRHGIQRATGDRIDRSTLKDEATNAVVSTDYAYDPQRLQRGEYVDLHCARPFKTFLPQTLNVLNLSGML